MPNPFGAAMMGVAGGRMNPMQRVASPLMGKMMGGGQPQGIMGNDGPRQPFGMQRGIGPRMGQQMGQAMNMARGPMQGRMGAPVGGINEPMGKERMLQPMPGGGWGPKEGGQMPMSSVPQKWNNPWMNQGGFGGRGMGGWGNRLGNPIMGQGGQMAGNLGMTPLPEPPRSIPEDQMGAANEMGQAQGGIGPQPQMMNRMMGRMRGMY